MKEIVGIGGLRRPPLVPGWRCFCAGGRLGFREQPPGKNQNMVCFASFLPLDDPCFFPRGHIFPAFNAPERPCTPCPPVTIFLGGITENEVPRTLSFAPFQSCWSTPGQPNWYHKLRVRARASWCCGDIALPLAAFRGLRLVGHIFSVPKGYSAKILFYSLKDPDPGVI